MSHSTQARGGEGAAAEPEFAAWIGLDWADQQHHWSLLAAGSQRVQQGTLTNTPEALQQWAAELHTRFQGRPVAVCLEQSRGAVVYQLSQFAHLVIYPAHPRMAAQFRQAFFPSGSKNDPPDSALRLDLLRHHRDRLRRLDPDTAQTRCLQILVQQRRRLVDDRTRQSNRLTAWLKCSFPQLLEWIQDIDSPLGCALLAQWPNLQALQSAHPGTLARFFRQHHSRSQERIRQCIQAIYQATPAVSDPALLEGGTTIVHTLARILKSLRESIRELDAAIETLLQSHPETPLFTGLPGAGPVLLPRLVAAFGTQRERYTDAYQLQCYSGIAPVTVRSGHSCRTQFRRACPRFLRQTFHEFAAHSLAKCRWARDYYDLQISRGKRHHAAVRAVAYKWQRILFRCWQDGVPYDEAVYLRSLEKHNSIIAKATPSPPTRLEWKTVAGFKKLSAQNT